MKGQVTWEQVTNEPPICEFCKYNTTCTEANTLSVKCPVDEFEFDEKLGEE